VLVDEGCGVMDFPTGFAGRHVRRCTHSYVRELLFERGDEVVMTEDTSRRIPYRPAESPTDIAQDIGQRIYVGEGGYTICVQERIAMLLDGLEVKYSVSGGKDLGLAGYDEGGALVTIVALIDSAWIREVRA
jgi:hypothetical protein